ncbi:MULTISPECIES: AraC family transcriptional regulator [Paraburkholderia]|uniref:AraC family transcriptional regulator n=1 Tax=Paraburkholderia TaxID=1822464 RepID=UPI002259A4CB|nr:MULTISPECIES: AraC family transcriptional regulator [Paraburkholderia]MCX4161607.1 AraC family transcriptional regulator [Paraburkholderia megapolitana]MDN7157103.1 AraC family transcriptional regulator [Paraburkholderia sp. CHISQ3]MDQ6494148.1 AraC family transcriptional regulator [Paraburkholderia megapolitana]
MSPTLIAALNQYMDGNGGDDGVLVTPIEGLFLMRSTCERLPYHVMYKPALCITVQGAKQVLFGDKLFDYGEMQALVVSMELPGIGRVTRASVREPYLGIVLQLDLGILREVIAQLSPPPKPNENARMGVFSMNVDGPLADCIGRMIQMLGRPQAAPILFPAIMREVSYWLLTGDSADEICKLVSPNGRMQRIAEAIGLLRSDIARPVRIEQLASTVRMSPSSFYQHFKLLTSLTPIQYQKQLRLLEARRLMVEDGASVTGSAYRVGYESVSQFSREYARMFGTPPKRDIADLQAALA